MQRKKELSKRDNIDINAEYIAAQFVEKGIHTDNIVIRPQGQFKRGFQRDILKTERVNLSNRIKFLEYISVCRNGIYDYLPQGFFHENHSVGLQKMREKLSEKKQKIQLEEQEARNFFLAFEREFYRQRIRLELEEIKSLQIFFDSHLQEIFLKFWNLANESGINFANLLYLFPSVYRFSGNIDIIKECFSSVLSVKVSIKKISSPTQKLSEDYSPILGLTSLGLDFVLGGSINDGIPALQITVGPLSIDKILDFLPEGKGLKLLKIMCGFFIPVEMENQIDIKLHKEEEQFILSEDQHNARLGYSTYT